MATPSFVLTALYSTETQKKTTLQAFHYLAVHVRGVDGKILKGYEYSMDEQYGYNLAIPNVPQDWAMLEQYLPFFCVMHGEFDYTRGATSLHEVDVLGKALDGKEYPLPDLSQVLYLDPSSTAHQAVVQQATDVLAKTYAVEPDIGMVKRLGALEGSFMV